MTLYRVEKMEYDEGISYTNYDDTFITKENAEKAFQQYAKEVEDHYKEDLQHGGYDKDVDENEFGKGMEIFSKFGDLVEAVYLTVVETKD